MATAKADKQKKRKRIALDLSDRDLARVAMIQEHTKTESAADVLRAALRIYEWVVHERQGGNRPGVVLPNGTVREIGLIIST